MVERHYVAGQRSLVRLGERAVEALTIPERFVDRRVEAVEEAKLELGRGIRRDHKRGALLACRCKGCRGVNGQLARWRVGQVRFSTFRWTRSATPRAGEPPDNFIRSAVAEAAGDGVVVGEAAAAADALAATEADSVAAAAVAEAEEVLSSALARLPWRA